jgi:hypothetical protein
MRLWLLLPTDAVRTASLRVRVYQPAGKAHWGHLQVLRVVGMDDDLAAFQLRTMITTWKCCMLCLRFAVSLPCGSQRHLHLPEELATAPRVCHTTAPTHRSARLLCVEELQLNIVAPRNPRLLLLAGLLLAAATAWGPPGSCQTLGRWPGGPA